MKIPKTPVEFDYDLWTTEDGKCMVRVKITGEVTEVNREVMRILRAEEKKLRRSYGSDEKDAEECEESNNSVLSLDALTDDNAMSSAWLVDPSNGIEELLTEIKEQELLKILTDKQRELYLALTREGLTLREFARKRGVNHKTVMESVESLRKKFKNIF